MFILFLIGFLIDEHTLMDQKTNLAGEIKIVHISFDYRRFVKQTSNKAEDCKHHRGYKTWINDFEYLYQTLEKEITFLLKSLYSFTLLTQIQ